MGKNYESGMRILFTTKYKDAPSTALNTQLLEHLNKMNGVRIDFYNENYAEYDVVLFMGYDPRIEQAKNAKKSIKVGVIDPRPGFDLKCRGVDFILANGIEMKDGYLKFTPNIFIYYIYPPLKKKIKLHSKYKKIVLGYHGNKVHLEEIFPRITRAMELLADDYEVEFWAMYNTDQLGKWSVGLPSAEKVKVQHIQWSEENYEKFISNVDIGIVPNLMPIKTDSWLRENLSFRRKNNEHKSDYVLRFKATSNPGRIFVFAQYGIPVVTDMFPSALQIIQDGVNGFVCYGTDAWYHALKSLADSPSLRKSIAVAMSEKFDREISPEVMNSNLLQFLKGILNADSGNSAHGFVNASQL